MCTNFLSLPVPLSWARGAHAAGRGRTAVRTRPATTARYTLCCGWPATFSCPWQGEVSPSASRGLVHRMRPLCTPMPRAAQPRRTVTFGGPSAATFPAALPEQWDWSSGRRSLVMARATAVREWRGGRSSGWIRGNADFVRGPPRRTNTAAIQAPWCTQPPPGLRPVCLLGLHFSDAPPVRPGSSGHCLPAHPPPPVLWPSAGGGGGQVVTRPQSLPVSPLCG